MANEFDDLNKEMAELTALQQGLGKAAEKDKETGVKAFAAATAKGTVDVAKGLGGLAKTVGGGDTSFAGFNAILDIATNALAGMAAAIPVAGEGLSQVTKAAGEAGKFMLQQLDQTTKAYNDLGKAGALTAKGMSGLQQQFTQSGLPLQSFTKIVGENAVTLARWRDTAGDGAGDLSKIVGEFTQGGDRSLRQLGMNAEQIGETTAAYISQQTRLGLAQSASNEELQYGTKKYAIELDKLSKLTGMSKDNIVKQQEKMLSDSRFRANLSDMDAQGYGQFKQGLQNFQTQVANFNEGLGQGIADLASGTDNTAASSSLMKSTGGAALGIVTRLKTGQITQAQAQNELNEALKFNQERQRQSAQYVAEGSAGFGKYSAISDMTAAADAKAADRADAAVEAQLGGQDKFTESTIDAQQSIERMNIEIQKMGFTFLPKAADAVDAVTKSLNEAIDFIKSGGKGKEKTHPRNAATAAGIGGTKGTSAGGGATVVAGAGGEGDAGAIMEAVANAPPKAKTAAPTEKASAPSPAGPSGSGNEQQAQSDKYQPGTPGSAPVTTATETDPKAQVEKAGLKIRPYGDVHNGGVLTDPALNIAKQIQSVVPNFGFFTGLNDAYHKKVRPDSKHALGRGMDFVLNGKPSPEDTQAIQKMIAGMSGVSLAKNEYFPPPYGQADKNTTGPHIHVQTSAAEGAILSGPREGYNPNASMNDVDVKPLNKKTLADANTPGSSNAMDPAILGMQLEQLDLLIASARNQLVVKQRILKAKS